MNKHFSGYQDHLTISEGADSIAQMRTKWPFRTWHHVCIVQGADRRVVVDGQTVEMDYMQQKPFDIPVSIYKHVPRSHTLTSSCYNVYVN